MIGYIYALISLAFFSAAHIFNKKSTKIEEHNALILRYISTVIVSLIGILIFDELKINFSLNEIIWVTVSGIIGVLGLIALFKSFKENPVAISLTIASFFPFIVMLQNIYFFNSFPLIKELTVMGLILFGIGVTVYERKSKKNKYNIILPLVTATGWGVYNFGIFMTQKESFSSLNFLFYAELISLITLIIYISFNKKIKFQKDIYNIEKIKYPFLAGITAIVAVYLMSVAFLTVKPEIVSSIVSTQLVFIALASHIIFKEKLKKYQYFGMLFAIIGLILLNYV